MDLRVWRQRIQTCLSLQAQHHTRWQNSLDWLNLRYLQNHYGGLEREWTEVHWVWNYYNTLIPSLYAKDPNVMVKAARKPSVEFAQTLREILTYHNRELGLKDAVQRAIGDTPPYGIGYVEVNYEPTDEEIKVLNARHKDSKESRQVLVKIKKAIERVFPSAPEEESPLLNIRQGCPTLRWVPAWRVLLAPGYHRIKEMPYLIVIEDVEPEDLKRNPRYKESQVSALKPTRRVASAQPMINSGNPLAASRGTPIPLVRLYHIWDRRNREYLVVADDPSAEELLHWPWPFSFDEFPVVELIFNDVACSEQDAAPYPMDDITPIKPQLIEKSLLRTDMIKARRRMAPLIMLSKQYESDPAAKKLEEAGIANIVFFSDVSEKAVRFDNPVRLPDDIYRIDSTIDNDLNSVSGFSQTLLAGSAPPGDATATEINQAGAGMNLRATRKIDIVETFLEEIERRLAMICWEKCDRDEIAAILGKPISEEMWPDLEGLSPEERRDRLNRELDFEIEAHSTQPEQIRLVEQNLWIRAVNMIKAAFPDAINDEKLLEQFLKKLGMKEMESVIKPPEEKERQVADQENQLLLQGMPQVVSPSDRHDVHILSHGQAATLAQAQGLDTRTIDAHTLQHNQMRTAGQMRPGARPQAGDMTSPAQAAVPEMQRKGTERFPDLVGQSTNLYENTGSEAPSGL